MNEDSTEHTLPQTERKNYALQRLVTDAMDILADHTDVSLLLQIKLGDNVICVLSEDMEQKLFSINNSQSNLQSKPQ